MRNTCLLIAFTLSLTACGATVQDFVMGAPPPLPVTPSTPVEIVVQTDGPMPLKVTPGAFLGSAAGVAIKATVTPTQQVYQAGDLAVSLSISRHRTNTDQ